MIPRFANPHAVLEKTQIVSRKELGEKGGEGDNSEPDLSRVEEFNEVMKRILAPFHLEEREKKRRKVQVEEDENDAPATSILFRLVSNGPPMLISLQPKPELYPKVREPEVEDNETQAKERRQRALAVAVDAEWIKKESLRPTHHPSAQSPVVHITLPSPSTVSPSLMILHHNKPIRQTRPPVDRNLIGYPYDSRAEPQPLEHRRQSYDCPVVDLNCVLGESEKAKTKRRRRRKIKKIEHHYWRPDPSIRGKCMGYAMGYGGRWDRMKKGVFQG